MQYRFYTWRARRPGAGPWKELGWSMTEDDARRWAEQSGHEIERLEGRDEHVYTAFGGALG